MILLDFSTFFVLLRIASIYLVPLNESTIYKSKRDVVNILSVAVENGNSEKITEKHVKNIKDMLGEDRIFH